MLCRGTRSIFSLHEKYTYIWDFSNPHNFRVSSILQTGSKTAFQSQLRLMDGLETKSIQFACYAVEHVNWVGSAGEHPLVFLGPATEVFQDWLPKQSVFASVKIPKDNLAASKVEKPTCLASLHNSSWHVSLLFLCLDVLCNFKRIIQKKKAAILARGKLLFFFFSKMKGWYFLTILSKPVAFYLAIMPQH